jgi:hypothetical protein
LRAKRSISTVPLAAVCPLAAPRLLTPQVVERLG